MKTILDILPALLEINKDVQARYHMPISAAVPRAMKYSELSTITLNIGRGAGKTQAINELARPGDLIICMSQAEKRRIHNRCATVKTIREYLHTPRGCRPDPTCFNRVWVDEPSMCFDYQHTLRDLYDNVSLSEGGQFIILGE